MFFAGITKEQRADASRDDHLTKEKSHDALAEYVSIVASRKTKARPDSSHSGTATRATHRRGGSTND
jgi:hypothetical protein